jgi:exopolysaccharide biosynthesis polyprenyl glycosylphosphotransferase
MSDAGLDERTLRILRYRHATSGVKRRGWLVRRLLVIADLFGLALAFVLAQALFPPDDSVTDRLLPLAEFALFAAALPLWLILARAYGLYDHDEDRMNHSTADDIVPVFHMVTVGAWLLFLGGALTEAINPELGKLACFWALAVGLVSLGRATARVVARNHVAYIQNTVIVGAGDVGQTIGRKLLAHPEYGLNLVGFVDANPREQHVALEHLELVGRPQDLRELVDMLDIERVIVAFSGESHEETLALLRSLKDLDVQIDIVPRLFEFVGMRTGLHAVEGLPLLGLPPFRLSRAARASKRGLDLALSCAALLVLAPFLAAIAVAIKLDSPGPVFFRQERMGRNNRVFRIWKLRTMTIDADARKLDVAHLNKHLLPGCDPRMFKAADDPRVTRLGRFLRRYSIDELPQLLNVVRGEMSLVGPRPLILEEDQHVREWARRRLDLKPGITGPWQVLGRTDIPFEEMIKLDYDYVTGWSVVQDLKLMIRTIPAVWRYQSAF